MANFFTRFLNGAVNGLTRPKGIVANFQHATHMFVDDTFRLAPKSKFLFYVRFEIDSKAIQSAEWQQKHKDEVGMLVKSADLPKFSFESVVKNQYNRKKLLYKSIKYDDVNITMHDDSAGIINAMWALYYGYYVSDRHVPQQGFEANHLRPTNTNKDLFRYGMDNNKTVDFFKSITIYTMSRRRFIGYTLINPRIKSWQHGSVAYSEGDFIESTMSLEYEAVQYSAGTVKRNSPKGFAMLHYDNVPSPLSVAGGGVATLTGDGGVLDGLEQIFGDVGSGATFNSFGGFLGTAIKTVNTYKNFKNLSLNQIKNEAVNILSNPGNISRGISAVGGVVGAIFPKSQTNQESTPATQKTMIG